MTEKGRRPRTLAGSRSRVEVPERVRWAVDLIDVRPTDHILEIGCGPGQAVGLVCQRLTRGTITAIDRSAVAVARTRERIRECVASGRARVERMTLTDARLGRRYPKVFAINVNAFWTTPAESLIALGRLLDPGGSAWLVYEPPSKSRLRHLRDSLPAQLELNGFRVAAVETQRFRSSLGLAIVGRPR
jgi:protein-L-isoaspartate O-methyltransferase